MTAVAWIIIGPLAAGLVTFIAGRLLGARRGWLSLAIAGDRRLHRRRHRGRRGDRLGVVDRCRWRR